MASAFGPSGPECECPIFCRMYQNLENLRANQKLLWLDIIDALIWVLVLFLVGIIGVLKNYKYVPKIIDLSQSPQAPLEQPRPQSPQAPLEQPRQAQETLRTIEIPQIGHCTIASKTRSGKSYKKLKNEEICQLPLLGVSQERRLSTSSDSSVSLSLSCSSYCPSTTPSSLSISSVSSSNSSRSSSSERSF